VVAFIHRFGASRNLCSHFHVWGLDGALESVLPAELRPFAANHLNAQDAEAVQARVRRRILRWKLLRLVSSKVYCPLKSR